MVDPAFSKRNENEEEWAKLQPWLEAHGYMLRPRYQPNWSDPPGTTDLQSESAIPFMTYARVMDATRISDGAQVVLKMVDTGSPGTQISGYLTTERGEQNHCLPLLELLQLENSDPQFSGLSTMVMPRMRDCDGDPRFESVREFVEFLQQVLEGLVFLHSRNIAHRDIYKQNIMVDGSRLIPGGWHFASHWMSSNGMHYIFPYNGDDSVPHMKSRTQSGPMRYYFIDFGLAVHFPSYQTRELVTGVYGRLREYAPELSETVPYDPFKVHVCMVGEMLNLDFFSEYAGLEILLPFTCTLCQRDPASRPDAEEALNLFRDLVSTMGSEELESHCVQPIATPHKLGRKATKRPRFPA
ncbi:kinase-like domain-containing protein [Mycena crocata]|nr:kinase-like domain-containing protein [Mycena crocata]